MKNIKYILLIAILALVVILPPSSVQAADVKVTIDGQYVTFTDQAPFIESGRTLVPVRAPMEKLGCDVGWDEVKRQAIITKDDTTAVFTIGSKTYTINNVNKTMDVEPKIAGGRSVFPIRYCAEAFGATVGWDSATYTVIITTGQVKPPVTSEKIEGTPFYQATPEQIQACKNGKMPNFTSKDFNQTSQAGKNASYDNWDFVFNNLPYKFYTDKSLVYMAQNSPVFRGYIDMGNGLQMVDLRFGSNLVSIMNVDPRVRLELLEW